jgi:leucyl-tRNA synthetase
MDPKNEKALASKKALEYWAPIDWYNGGMEHTVLHLLYSRFWNQFLYNIGVVPTLEPYKKRTSHGIILASDGEKMSKSRGNVVNPDDMIREYGADALRTYILFMGPFDQAVAWDTNGLVGVVIS